MMVDNLRGLPERTFVGKGINVIQENSVEAIREYFPYIIAPSNLFFHIPETNITAVYGVLYLSGQPFPGYNVEQATLDQWSKNALRVYRPQSKDRAVPVCFQGSKWEIPGNAYLGQGDVLVRACAADKRCYLVNIFESKPKIPESYQKTQPLRAALARVVPTLRRIEDLFFQSLPHPTH